jgi:nucleotide-binding universal stress UspA family protein
MYKRIMVPVDGSNTAKRGLEEAIKLAQVLGSELKLVHVVNELVLVGGDAVYYDFPTVIESLVQSGRTVLKDAEALVKKSNVAVTTELIEAVGNRAAEQIVTKAKAWPADLIVMGTHGRRGLGRWALGSDAESVLRASPIPVLLVRAPE